MASADLAFPHAAGVVLSHFSELIGSLNRAPLRVYAYLARIAPTGEPVDISQRDLARAANLARSNVQIALAQLEDLGLLRVLPGTRTLPARYMLIQLPDQVPDPLGRGPTNLTVDLPASPIEKTGPPSKENRSTCEKTGPHKPLILLEKNGPSRAFHSLTALHTLSTVSECSAVSDAAAEIFGRAFRSNDPLKGKFNQLATRFRVSDRDVIRILQNKVREKRGSRYQIRSFGALYQFCEAELALMSTAAAPRRPPAAELAPPPANDRETLEGLLRLMPDHPQAWLWREDLRTAAGGLR